MKQEVSIKDYVDKRFDELHLLVQSIWDEKQKAIDEYKSTNNEWKELHNGLQRKMDNTLVTKELFFKTIVDLKEVIDTNTTYRMKQEGSIKIIIWLVGIGVTILVGLAIRMITTGK